MVNKFVGNPPRKRLGKLRHEAKPKPKVPNLLAHRPAAHLLWLVELGSIGRMDSLMDIFRFGMGRCRQFLPLADN